MKSFKHLFVMFLAILLLCSGCASYKYRATIPSVLSPERFTPVQFRVVEVNGLMNDQERAMIGSMIAMRNRQAQSVFNKMTGQTKRPFELERIMPEIEKKKTELLSETLTRKYPHLFSSGKDAVPLRVDMTQENDTSVVSTMIIGLCTLGLLPAPLKITHDISMKTSILQPPDSSELRIPPQKGRLKINGWMTVYSPLGLIPFPGKGDAKWSTLLPLFPPTSQNPLKCSERQYIELCVRGGAADKKRLVALYGSIADLVTASITSLDQQQVDLLKENYYKSMRMY